jgi:hypothetical protein
MEKLNPDELWRRVPPEEKVDLINQAHSSGVKSILIVAVISATLAISLQLVWIFYGGLLLSPLFFQYSSMKLWRRLKPKTMLEYLAARSAARRYAFAYRTQDLGLLLLYRATLKTPKSGNVTAFEDPDAKLSTPCWVALFPNTLIIMIEGKKGAMLQFGHSFSDPINITSTGEGKDLEIHIHRKNEQLYLEEKLTIATPYPGLNYVADKKIKQQLNNVKKASEVIAVAKESTNSEDSFMTDLDSLWQLD